MESGCAGDVCITARIYAGFLAELEDRAFGALATKQYGRNSMIKAWLAATI